jgi:hypothetical protein
MGIYDVPGLMDTLMEYKVARDLGQTGAARLCAFFRALTKALLEPRQSEPIIEIAKILRERGDIEEAKVLCTFLVVDERAADRTEGLNSVSMPGPTTPVACWVTDIIPPGGRHDNDHLNYRNIRLVPTVAELTSATKPYLPLATGENNCIEDPVTRLLGNLNSLKIVHCTHSSSRTP